MIDECLDKSIYYNFMDEFLDFKNNTVNLIDFKQNIDELRVIQEQLPTFETKEDHNSIYNDLIDKMKIKFDERPVHSDIKKLRSDINHKIDQNKIWASDNFKKWNDTQKSNE